MAPIQFGILMIPYQMLDVAGPLDILSSSSKALISSYETAGFPRMEGLTEKAIDIVFHHINTTMDPVLMTANISLTPTTTVDACPPLDYLLIGGPDPMTFKLDERFAEFLRKHVAAGKGIFTTCTGALAISSSGVLDGRKATTNHMALELAKQMRPQVNWVKDQWVEDGQFWTAGGACAGMDMFAHWVAKNYAAGISKLGLESLDFEPRDIEGKRTLRAEMVV
ncbi:DJ-1/PfpI family protein-like protein [Leptodontidium sp. 2 PMI_412]|nr:putative intracellular protease 1 [Leptodontidium sp. MPI-SDFR-AT-0119]KAH9214226.1 DJ-1/PfpI family protein-like protein [Leptodontidium sp. 2 PMI_412]